MIATLLCMLFDHDWGTYMVRGDDGECGTERCARCRIDRDQGNMPCRCLGKTRAGCKCQFPVFAYSE